MFVAFYLVLGECNVVAGSIADDKGDTECIGAVLVGELDRGDDVALTLRHFLAVFVVNHAVEVHRTERYFTLEVKAKEYHAGHPLEYEVAAGLHDVGRVMDEVLGLRISERKEWPLAR